MSGRPQGLAAYLALSAVVDPVLRLWLARRSAQGREDPVRIAERFGRPGLARPEGRLVWLHGASVGEAMSILPLVAALQVAAPRLSVLVTTGTVTAARRMADALPCGAVHQYLPVDTRAAVRRFLDHWQPDLAVWVESEIWPRLLVETARRAIPMTLLNARLSARSARNWQRLPATARHLFGLFDWILTQDGETADRLSTLGASNVERGQNLKSAVLVPECPPAEMTVARTALAGRRVWLAASTHDGEEAVLAAAQRQLPDDVLLILAPRHPERGDAVAEVMRSAGLATARRSAGERPGPATNVWLADTMGEMGLWYRLAPISFVGGSLVPRGGHTPFEPAACGSVILHGPHVENFAPAYAALAAANGAVAVDGADAIAAAVTGLLGDPASRAALLQGGAGVRDRMAPDLDAIAHRLLALAKRPPARPAGEAVPAPGGGPRRQETDRAAAPPDHAAGAGASGGEGARGNSDPGVTPPGGAASARPAR